MSKYEEALVELRRRLLEELQSHLEAIIVYGSVARKEATPESDIDVLIVAEKLDPQLVDKISQIRYQNDLKHGTLTTLIYRTPQEIEARIRSGSLFTQRLLMEGVTLYDNGIFRGIRQKAVAASR